MKKILIINGHPDKESFCFHLAESYKKGADSAGADCKLIKAQLGFQVAVLIKSCKDEFTVEI